MVSSNAPKLLPCAHCGSTDIHLSRMCIHTDEGMTFGWVVECYECGIQTQPYPEDTEVNDMDDYTFAHLAMDDAIGCAVDSWNTRVHRNGFGG